MNYISNSLQRKSWIFTFCPDLWMFPNLFDGGNAYKWVDDEDDDLAMLLEV